MMRRTTRVLGWMTILMLALAAPALADSHKAGESGKGKGNEKSAAAGQKGKGPSAEERARMAEAHEKLAACLRSTRPIGECHSEMKKAHQGMGHGCDCEHGEGHCSEHGSCEGGHHGEGHGQGHGAHGKGKTGKTPAPGSTTAPTTSGPTQ